MKITKKAIIRAAFVFILITSYPLFVFIYTLSHVAVSDLEGGRHGPLDAYRHTLASAVVAYTLDARAVDFVTSLMEGGLKDSNTMDRRNNKIGAEIGSQANSFSEIEAIVHDKVLDGGVNTTTEDKITWLPKEKWRNNWAW